MSPRPPGADPRPTGALVESLRRAIGRREPLLTRLEAEDTDCARLLHGVTEGAPGVTIDRYGALLLVQTTQAPLASPDAPELLAEAASRALGARLSPVWNHRPAFRRGGFRRHHRPGFDTSAARCREGGLTMRADPRHGGLDPLVFLDLRAGRRRLRGLAEGRRVLNLFAYTCTAGVACAAAGAREVVNVDFARSALAVGASNATLNGIGGPWFSLVHEDFFPVARQLAGLPVKGRGARRPYLRLAPRRFGLCLLDPPRWAKSPFGAVDVVRDYPALFRPALLTTRAGGWILATNHAPRVDPEGFVAALHRTAEKNGRRLASVEQIAPDDDFPSPDGRPPLKMVLARVEER